MPTPGTTGLEAWWELEESSGTRFDAHSSNDLTDNNTVTQAAGKVGNAAQFTRGELESLSVADNASLSFADEALSFGGWMYLDSIGDPAAIKVLIAKGSLAGNNTSEYAVYMHPSAGAGSTATFRAFVRSATAVGVVNASTFGVPSTGTWYFVIAVHDPDGDTVKISVNAGTQDSVAHTTGCRDGSGSVFLGAASDAARHHDGRLDETFVWRRVLTTDEIDWLYNSGAGRAYSELTAPAGSRPPLIVRPTSHHFILQEA